MTATHTLVLVHAFPMGAGMWRPQLDAVPGWRIVTPSLPGFDGRPIEPERTIDGFAGDLLASLDRLGIERAVFAGLSMGGYVIFGVLRQAPQRVAGLVLADTRTSVDNPDRRAARVKSIAKARTEGPSAIADEMLPGILGRTTHATRPQVVAQVRALIEAQPGETIAAALEAMKDRPDSLEVLSRVRVPTLMLVGEEDTVTPVSDAEEMQRVVPRSEVVTIPGAGHMSNLEDPERFNDALRAFVVRTWGPASAGSRRSL